MTSNMHLQVWTEEELRNIENGNIRCHGNADRSHNRYYVSVSPVSYMLHYLSLNMNNTLEK